MSVLKLKEFRKKAKMSQRELAAALDIAQPSYWAWEKETSFPNARQIKQLCEILNCTPNELLGVREKYQDAMSKLDKEL